MLNSQYRIISKNPYRCNTTNKCKKICILEFIMYLNIASDNLYQEIMQKLKLSFSLDSISTNMVNMYNMYMHNVHTVTKWDVITWLALRRLAITSTCTCMYNILHVSLVPLYPNTIPCSWSSDEHFSGLFLQSKVWKCCLILCTCIINLRGKHT